MNGIRKVFSGPSLASVLALVTLASVASILAQKDQEKDQKQEKQRREEQLDYYQKWLDQDVLYIIATEEKSVFNSLTNAEEKDNFIEQFWRRRDPDPATIINEFKEEHYGRLAYVNERFASGKPGWRTDRGRIYLKFGPPDRKETHPGGNYQRKYWEGGGSTAVFPFERWWYRYLDGVGADVEIEFVDSSLSGEYRLALDADEKDAHLFTPMGGNLQELDGELTRGDRITRRYMGNQSQPENPDLLRQFNYKRMQDQIWYRVDQRMRLEKPPELKNPKLRELVKTRVLFGKKLPVKTHFAYYRLSQQQYLIPVSLKVQNRELTYKLSSENVYTAEVDIYLRLSSLNGRTFYEFDDKIYSHYSPQEFPKRTYQYSVYQKLLHLPAGRYKVDLLVQSEEGERASLSTLGLVVPDLSRKNEGIGLSPVTLSRNLSRLLLPPDKVRPFVIGEVRLVPVFENVFGPDEEIGVYLQAYGFQTDAASSEPLLRVRYEIVASDGRLLRTYDDDGGRSYSVVGNDRLVVTKKLPLLDLPKGKYRLVVHVEDGIASKEQSTDVSFEVVG